MSSIQHQWARLRASGLRREIAAHPIAWAYLFLALAFGLILVVLVPPFQTNDEPEHYFRSWAIAEGQLLVGQGAVVELPSNVAWLFADLKAIEVTQGKAKYDTSLTLSHLSDSVSAQRVAQATLTGTYSPIGYIPQALGIDLVRLFGGSPLMALYVARLFMLGASVALAFWALRLTPGSVIGTSYYPAVCLIAENHVVDDPERPMKVQGVSRASILIEDDVWLGAGVIAQSRCRRARRARNPPRA